MGTLEGAAASLPVNINKGQLASAIGSAVDDFKYNNQDAQRKVEKVAAQNVNAAVNQANNAFRAWLNSNVQNRDGKQLAKKISSNLSNQLSEDAISKAREFAAAEGLGYKVQDAAQSIAD